jgi:hypothetical protein
MSNEECLFLDFNAISFINCLKNDHKTVGDVLRSTVICIELDEPL